MSDKRGKAIGITGGIGCGKSETLRLLEAEGLDVLDTDVLARALAEPGSPLYPSLKKRFGPEFFRPDGRLDRRRLAQWIFAHEEEREALNRLLHPEIRRRWKAWLAERLEAGRSAAVAIPLLYETGATEGWDAVVCVSASDEVVLERLKKKGMTEAEIRSRMAAQWPLAEKEKRADYILRNNGDRETLKRNIRQILKSLLQKGA